jgi:transposase
MKPTKSIASRASAKTQALRHSGTLNTNPERVLDPLFLEEEFFDPQDLTQVKYEMLRRVQKEGMAISTAASSFGVSRPSFYKAQHDFAQAGMNGLIARRRGPRRRHKLTPEVLEFVTLIQTQEPLLRTSELIVRLQEKFGIRVHRRSLERALLDAKKKPHQP